MLINLITDNNAVKGSSMDCLMDGMIYSTYYIKYLTVNI